MIDLIKIIPSVLIIFFGTHIIVSLYIRFLVELFSGMTYEEFKQLEKERLNK